MITGLFINNEFKETKEKQKIVNLSTGEIIAEVSIASTKEVECAINAARKAFDAIGSGLRETLTRDQAAYPMFSREHIQAIVDLVNKDEFITSNGRALDLTMQLAVKLDDTSCAYTFVFEKGSIIRLDSGANAPFVISAARPVWEQVFLGKLDSFVAVTQGKMKLVGQLGQLSKWYVPFSRLFQIFKQVKFT